MTKRALRVLLVDDEQEFVDTLCLRLQTRGIEAECVYSADDALARIGEGPDQVMVDVVVLDLRMPGMSGLEAMRQIEQRWPTMGRVMLTGHGADDVAAEVAQLGGLYLNKPVDIERLVQTVRQARLRSAVPSAAGVSSPGAAARGTGDPSDSTEAKT